MLYQVREGLTIKILIYTDPLIPPALVKNTLERRVKNVESLQFELFEMNMFATRKKKPQVSDVREYWGDPQDIIDRLEGVNILVVHTAPVTAEVIEAGKDLEAIACCRGGPVNVNVSAATERGIPVLYTPGRNADGVADLAIGLMIAEARHIARAHSYLKQGVWKHFPLEKSIELLGKTVGIVGFGNVGRKVSERAKGGFGMKVLVFDPYVPKEEIEEAGGESVDLETLLRESDFVSLHCRLPPGTKALIGEKELLLMKETAYLINTARGNALDYAAAYQALKSKRIAGAAFDVYDKEPITPDNPLIKLDNVTLTPHIGGMTKEGISLRAVEILSEDLERLIKGERPKHVQNPSVYG